MAVGALLTLILLVFSTESAVGQANLLASGSPVPKFVEFNSGEVNKSTLDISDNRTLAETNAVNEAAYAVDHAALVAFYQSTEGDRWSNADQWLSDEPLGDWHGVFTGKDGRVEMLVLPENGLAGRIPEGIADLDRLRVLNLARNELSGQIPAAIGNVHSLLTLKLDNNRLSGRIPPEIGNLADLESLELSFNRLRGSIPRELANLARLHTLRITDTGLSGEIPPELGNLGSLKTLNLNSNTLRGALPTEIGQLPLLVELSLSSNGLSGAIPPELGRLPHLGVLNLSWNRFTGEIPAQLANPPRLNSLLLGGNSLSGSIPNELGGAANLAELYLHDNDLNGPIPPGLGNLDRLRRLYLNENQLTGPIPGSLGQIVDLEWFNASNNQLTGPIPPELGHISNLRVLNLAGNQLSGAIHPALHRLHDLQILRLGTGHQFDGCLPAHWSNVETTDIEQIQLPNCDFGLPGLDAVPGRLEPGFDPAVRDYELWVGNNVEVITLVPILADATVEYLDQAGQELGDANEIRLGHQIEFEAAANQFRIRALSGDGLSEVIYSLTARRMFPYQLRVLASEPFAAPGNEDLMHNVPNLVTEIDGQRHEAGFLSHFHATGGLDRWGFPTSEVFTLEANSLTQFYQRGVVDFHNVGTGWVTERRLAWDYVGGGSGGSVDLGVEPDILNPSPGDVSGPWLHKVSNLAIDGTLTGFADFYSELGGVSAFGFAKTDARADTNADGTLHVDHQTPGFIRQYFQAAVFEFHPGDRNAPVKLSLLGDTLRNLLVPSFSRELAFSAASPLVDGDAYLPAGVPTPKNIEITSRPVANAGQQQEHTFLSTDHFSIQLYEGGAQREPAFERPRLDTFNNLTTRFIWWDLEIEFLPRRAGILRSPVEIRYFRPDGSLMYFDRLNIGLGLNSGTERINFSGRHDRQFLGGGSPGNYRVEASHAGMIVAAAQFEVLSTPVPGYGPFVDLLQTVPWAQSPNTREQQEALLRLADIHAIDQVIAMAISSWEWVRSEPTPREFEVIQLLASLTRKNPELTRRLVAQPWLADGVSFAEWRNLLGAHEFNEQLANFALDSPQDDPNSFAWQIRATRNLARIELEIPQLNVTLQAQPWFVDGINESEAALISVLIETVESEEITRELLASPLPQTRRITTPYSDEIDLTVVSRHSIRLPTNLMDRLEFGIRAIEEHVAVPWPSTDVIVFLDPDLNVVLDDPLGGFYTHDYIAVGRSWAYLPTLYHELSHFYFFSGDEPLWLQEGGPEYLEHHARWKTGELSTESWEQELRQRMDSYCYRYDAHTVADYLEAVAALDGGDIRRSAMWYCHYQIGHDLIFQVRQLLGEQSVGAALNQVILTRVNTGVGASDEEVLEAFRTHARADQAEDLEAIIESVYGEPMAG